MIRTGIFGGSFNPIHNGHINLAQHILQCGEVDEIWLMVSPHNPLKESTSLWDENFRLQMAQAATADCENIYASDFEFHLFRPNYTWRTLQELEKAYPKRSFSLIIGADNWLVFEKWANHKTILQNYPILIYPREGYPIQIQSLPTGVKFIEAPLFPWSSTQIREALNQQCDVSDMLPPQVIQLLKERSKSMGTLPKN